MSGVVCGGGWWSRVGWGGGGVWGGGGGGWGVGFFFFKQKTAYEIKECDWSSDVCSSDLRAALASRMGLDPRTPIEPVDIGEIPALPGLGEAPLKDSMDRAVQHQIGRASCRERV